MHNINNDKSHKLEDLDGIINEFEDTIPQLKFKKSKCLINEYSIIRDKYICEIKKMNNYDHDIKRFYMEDKKNICHLINILIDKYTIIIQSDIKKHDITRLSNDKIFDKEFIKNNNELNEEYNNFIQNLAKWYVINDLFDDLINRSFIYHSNHIINNNLKVKISLRIQKVLEKQLKYSFCDIMYKIFCKIFRFTMSSSIMIIIKNIVSINSIFNISSLIYVIVNAYLFNNKISSSILQFISKRLPIVKIVLSMITVYCTDQLKYKISEKELKFELNKYNNTLSFCNKNLMDIYDHILNHELQLFDYKTATKTKFTEYLQMIESVVNEHNINNGFVYIKQIYDLELENI